MLFSLLMVPLLLWSQEDSLSHKLIAPAVYFDFGKAAASAIPEAQKWEGGVELIWMGKIQTVLEMGQWDLKPNSAIENGSYQVTGTYQRVGVGFLPYVDAQSRLGVGFRYASSNFSDQGEYTISSTSELQPDYQMPIGTNGLSANWYELVFYSDKSLNKWLAFGFNFRLRFMQSYSTSTIPDIQVIPGYGRAQDKTVPAVNLFIKIQPF